MSAPDSPDPSDESDASDESGTPSPGDLQRLFETGVAHHQNGRLDQARTAYTRLLDAAPKQADIIHLLGVVHYQLHDLEQAAETIRNAIELKSTDASFWSNLGNVLRAQNDLPAAIHAYQTALELDANLADASNNLANAYIEDGQLELATETLEALCQKSPNHPEAQNNLGIVLKAVGRVDEAIAAFARAVELRGDYVDALQNLGNTYLAKGEQDKALDSYAAGIAIAPDDLDLRLSYGHAFFAKGDLERAELEYEKAAGLGPQEARCLVALGRVHQEQSSPEQAEKDYKRALDLDTENADALNNLGVINRQRGDLTHALDFFARAADSRADYLEALFNRAAVQIELGALDAAEAVLLRIRETWPTFQPARQCLADVYDRKGDAAKSKEILEQWLTDDPDDPIANHLLLAANGADAERCSVEYVREEFDRGAEFFDSRLTQLDYKGPELVVKSMRERYGEPRNDLDVLDAGCGTGLSAKALAPYAKRLVGVDLSSGMMDQAGKLGLYESLHCEELTTFLNANAASYDLVIAMDVLIYFGELEEVLSASRRALRDGGTVIFSVEARDDESGYQLLTSGRFNHSEHYVRTAAAMAGFEELVVQSVVIRMERNKPVWGWLVRGSALGSRQGES